MKNFQLDLDQNFSIRFYPDHQAMNAVDVMQCLGVGKENSRRWCNCPFNSSYTFSVTGVDDYVICQRALKSFLRELVFLKIISYNCGNDFFTKLHQVWQQHVVKVETHAES